MNKKYKLLLTSFFSLIILTNLQAKELYVNVNYGGSDDLHNTARFPNLDYSTAKIDKFNPETVITNTDNNLTNYDPNATIPQGYATLEDARAGMCKDLYLIDGSNTLIEKVKLDTDSADSTVPEFDNVFQNYGFLNSSFTKNLNIPSFTPYIELKSGSFKMINGSVDGFHSKSYTDINYLMKMVLVYNHQLNQNEIVDEQSVNGKELTNYQKIAKNIKDNFNINNWTYKAYYHDLPWVQAATAAIPWATAFPGNENRFFKYINNFENLAKDMIDSKELDLELERYLTYILDIMDIGKRYKIHYFSGLNYNKTIKSNYCMFDDEIKDVVDDLNTRIKNSETLDETKLKSFINNYGFNYSIFNINRFLVNIEVTDFKIADSTFSNYWQYDERYGWFVQVKYQPSKMEFSKLYGLKIIDKSGEATGTYVNKLTFTDDTTEGGEDILFSRGEEVDPDPSTPGITSNKEFVEQFDNIELDASSLNLPEEDIFQASLSSTEINTILGPCDKYFENKFINNVVYLDTNTFKFGNNQFLLKNGINDTFSKKPNAFMSENIYLDILKKAESEHLLSTIYNDVVNNTETNKGFTFTNQPIQNVMYFYTKLVDESGVDASCKNLFSDSKMSRPFVIFKENNMNVFENQGRFADSPHAPFEQPQRVQPINSIVLNDKVEGVERETDGSVHGEIEKVLDLASSSGLMLENKSLQIPEPRANHGLVWKSDYTIATTYYPLWYPKNTDDLKNYGPVGPFFERKEFFVKEKYLGCDGEDWDSNKSIPAQTECFMDACSAEYETETTNENNETEIVNYCGERETTKGTYSNLVSGSCQCNAPHAGYPQYDAEQEETSPNRRLQVNKYCVYEMEEMAAKIRKRKYYYSPQDNNGELMVYGFNPADEDYFWGDMEEIKGEIYPTEYTIKNRVSNPLSNISPDMYTWEIDPYTSDWSDNSSKPDGYDSDEHSCDWEQEFIINGKIFTKDDVVDAEEDLADMLADDDFKKGKEIAKTMILSSKMEDLAVEYCNADNTGGNVECIDLIINSLNASDWSGLGITKSNFDDMYNNYLKDMSELGFGSKIVLKNINSSVIPIEPRISNTFNSWELKKEWTSGDSYIFKNSSSESYIFKNSSSDSYSPDYNWRELNIP